MIQLSHSSYFATFLVGVLASPVGAGVVGHYSFDSDYSDDSGNGNHANFVDVGVAGNSGVVTTAGDFVFGGGAMEFGSDRDYLAIPSRTFGTGSAYSISFWAQADDASRQWNMVIGERGNTNFFIAPNGSANNLRWRSNNNAGGTRQVDFATGVNDTDWHHYVIVATAGRTLSLYLDGSLVSTATNVQTGLIIDSIGAAYTDGDFDFEGRLDEVWIFDEALDSGEVANLFDTNDAGIAGPPVDLSVTKLHVILLGGQSNADGRAAPGDLPTTPENLRLEQEDVSFYYRIEGGGATYGVLEPGLSETNGFGPEITLGHCLAKLYRGEPNTRIAIIKYANGGTNLVTQWAAGGDSTTNGDGSEYRVFQETVNSGRSVLTARYPNATQAWGGMLWVQGESDASSSTVSAAYEENLRRFIGDVRATYGEELPFYVSRLSDGQTSINAARLAEIRSAQTTVAAEDPRNFLIDTDGFGMKSDELHFTAGGQQAIGTATANEVAYAIWRSENFTAVQIVASLGERMADPDGDGRTNEEEFSGLSDPVDPTDSFTCWVRSEEGGNTAISYQASPLRAYTVQMLDPMTYTWLEILPAEVGSGMVVSRDLPSGSGVGIFRVGVTLP